eukprot:m.102788 g.102788  ORF g.102788 m.102788 type:complete len:120 (-) comp51548_c0_seq1:594-953(-)
MADESVFERVQRYAPVCTGVIGISTIVTVMIVSRARDDFTGGLAWPYISDTGRDKPQYYLFAVGLSVTGFFFALTTLRLFNIMKTLAVSPARQSRFRMFGFLLFCSSFPRVPTVCRFSP